MKLPKIEDSPPTILSAPRIADSWLLIVGIVGDARNDGLGDPVKPAIYISYTLTMWQGTQILVRSNVPPLALLHAVQKQLAGVNPDQQTYSIVRDLETWITDLPEWQQEHLAAWIFGILAWLALALAAVGLYSVVSYVVAQRTNEFGIRMALGAQPTQVMRIVFASTVVSGGSGIAAGLALTPICGFSKERATSLAPPPLRPALMGCVVPILVRLAAMSADGSARHGSPLAPQSFRLALDQKIAPPSRKARSCGEHS